MNYIHHAIIGVGTASMGVMAVEALGTSRVPFVTLALGAVVIAAGSIATDLDHPKSFISHSIPSKVVRIALAILAIPMLASLGVLLTTDDLQGSWNQFSALVLGWDILRWSLAALGIALGLIVLSWLLYKSLHHRGPLHSLVFTVVVNLVACLVLWGIGLSWVWGLVLGWGWFWHILADGLTTEGVPFSWPFNDNRAHTLPTWACGVGRVMLSLTAIGSILVLIFLRISGTFVL
jgi:membrane-bound metal-dependent hydrolase YbcI (DUF457 family)